MRRGRSLVFIFLFLSSCIFSVTISIPNSSNYKNSSIEIPVNIDNLENIAGFQFTINFNPSVLKIISVEKGDLTDAWNVLSNTQKQGEIKVIGFKNDINSEVSKFSGSLCIFKFDVIGNPSQSTNLTFNFSKLSDKSGFSVSHTTSNGNFTVLSTPSVGGGGCFIATACFGNYDHPFVKILREFRDKFLIKNVIGKKFVHWYYLHSPEYAEIIKNRKFLKIFTIIILFPFVILCYLVLKGLIMPFILLFLLFFFFKKTGKNFKFLIKSPFKFLLIFYLFNIFNLFSSEWTIMVYLDGDNDLEEYAINDFLEISEVGSDENINIVVQFDRIGGFYTDIRYGNWTESNRFYITKGMTPERENAINDWGDGTGGREVNMGDPNTLKDFINWAKKNYPAKKYALILWNHGGGWKSLSVFGNKVKKKNPVKEVCYDDTSNDYLSIKEVREAISDNYIDLIGFDACLMGMIEVATEINGFCYVMVASEESETISGWSYNNFLLNLKNNPNVSPEELCLFIVNSSSQETMAGIKMNKISELNQILNSILQSIMNSNDWLNVILSRENTRKFDVDFLDIYHFFENYYLQTENSQIKNYIESFRSVFSEVIICDNNTEDNAYGLSIYFPSYSSEIDPLYNENTILFAKETLWDEFLNSFVNSNPFIGYIKIYSEDFSSGIPENWEIIDGYNDGYTWMTQNPKNRSSKYLEEPFAIVDSDWAGNRRMDEQLITSAFNFKNYNKVFLKLSNVFWSYSDEIADIDLKIGDGEWINLKRYRWNDEEGIVIIDVSDMAGGKDDVRFRFHYYNAYNDWFWAIDNFEIFVNLMKGDINTDGSLDILDVILCLRMAEGLDPVNLETADINNDGVINIDDVILIAKKAIGLE